MHSMHRAPTAWVWAVATCLLWVGDAVAADRAAWYREARQANPSVQAARDAWRAAHAEVDAAGRLPDPVVTYGHFVQSVETRVGPQQQQVGVRQTLPWFGSLERRRAVARSGAEAERARAVDTWLAVRAELDVALNAVHRIDGALAIEEEGLALLEQFEGVARARLRVDAGRSADVLRIQVELARADDRVRALRQRRGPAVARVNALLDRALDAPLGATPELPVHVAPASLDSLERRVLAHHPALGAVAIEQRRQERRAAVAADTGKPAFTVGLVHTFVGERGVEGLDDDGRDATLATLSVNVPLWRGRVDAAVQGARERQARWRSIERATRNDLLAELRDAVFELDDADRRVALHRDTLVPKAEESLRAQLDAYASARTDFGALIDVQRTLLDLQRGLLDARVDRADARARLDRLAPTASAVDPTLLEVSR